MGNFGCSETAPPGGEPATDSSGHRSWPEDDPRVYTRGEETRLVEGVPPDEALASRVAQRRQPGPSSSEASASEKALRGHHDRIQQWVEGCEGERGLKLTKVHELLTREGVDVSYSSVYRYAAAQFVVSVLAPSGGFVSISTLMVSAVRGSADQPMSFGRPSKRKKAFFTVRSVLVLAVTV